MNTNSTMALVVLLILDTPVKFCIASVNKPVLRVIDGRNASDHEYPFVVRLEAKKSLKEGYDLHAFCTGSLVSSQWVLTAAHCVQNNIIDSVKYGDMSLLRNETTSLSKILKKITPPSYSHKRLGVIEFHNNDIAFLLVEKISMDGYARLSAADEHTFIGKPVIFAGYGQTVPPFSELRKNISNFYKLREVEEKLPLQVGEGVVFNIQSGQPPMILVAPKCARLTHQPFKGDSGGPLFYKDHIIGVTSIVMPYSEKYRNRAISYFVPISGYLNWIYDTVKEV